VVAVAGRSDEEVRVAAERVMQELDFREEEARLRGERFERLDEENLRRKLAGDAADSPFINGLGWGSAPPGGTANFTVNISNPDPVSYSAFTLFGYLFFGPANSIQSADLSLTAVDTRFPRYWRGLGVAAGGSASASFSIAVPGGITPGVYFGNCYLVRRGSFDVGQVFDRSCFDFSVL
jgi:hypothetical protein